MTKNYFGGVADWLVFFDIFDSCLHFFFGRCYSPDYELMCISLYNSYRRFYSNCVDFVTPLTQIFSNRLQKKYTPNKY